MLSYAFQVLNEQGYKNIATEKFNNTAELMAAILAKGIAIQIKRGLGKEYIPQTEAMSSLKGKLDITESIKTQTMLKKQMICSYDEFSVNGMMNRIIKSTVELLLKSDISKQRKKELRKLMVYWGDVETVDLYSVNWNMRFDRNNQTYRLLISICYLVVKGLLQTNSDGTHTLHSGNLYQIFTYVKNKETELASQPHEVSGMLLYAKTDEEIYPDNKYQMSGNQITVRTLDLNLPFSEIAEQLNMIVKSHFDLSR